MKILTALLVAMLTQADAAHQAPQISFDVLETSPPSPAALHRGDHVYVRIRYETNTPMWIEGRYSYRGTPSREARTSGAGLVASGKGELLVWASFVARAGVDSIELVAYSNGDRSIHARQQLPVDFVWDGQPGPAETPAPWVGPLRVEEEARQQQAFAEMEHRFYSPGSGGFGIGAGLLGIVGLLGLVVVLGGFVWPIYGTIRWRGAWRIAAAVPLAAGVLWTLKDAYDLVRDATSHNLLPFEYAIGAAVTVPYMIIVSVCRKMSSR
jgi:hypothetical protein